VGYVTSVEQHPNADRLTLCAVDIGSERVQVVCGAPNVAAKQKIAFAKVGAGLFNAHSGKVEALKAARIRGVVSEGMICSERELGTGDDHTGILVLPDDAPVGTPLSDYLGDYILDLEVTPNRPDCLSVLGVAHEAATLTGATVREPDCSYPEEGPPIETAASVEIADPDLCHRYTASMITGIKVGPSPRWLQDRLLKAGMRPINNVVDITNYVMLEYNQPLHAFDFDTLREGKVVVRRARPGEVLVSLDGVERRLSPSMLVIADARDAAALGGVIGSAHTEMTETTTTVLLESATFSPVNNRRMAQALRISTEASTRFEKGLRPELAPIALRRATQLIHRIAGGVVSRGILDVFPARDRHAVPTLTLTMGRLRKVLGIDLPIERVEQVLVSLGFLCDSLNGNALRVTVPYWRSDINIEDDLVEEVARIIGYEEIPTTMLSTPIPQYQPDPMQELKERVKDLLAACEMQEVITYSLTSLEGLQKVKALDSGIMPLKLANPMSDQQQYLRTTLRNSLLSTLAANRLHDQGPLAIFELGRIYLPRERDSQESGGLPEEREVVAGVLAGPQWDALKSSPAGDLGFYDAKGAVEKVLEELGVAAAYEPGQDPALHPGKCARVVAGDATLGVIGEVHPVVVEAFEIERGPVALFELDIKNLLEATSSDGRRYSPVSRFPSATRDLSLVLDLDVPAAKVQEVIVRQRLVDRAVLFDVYSGENLPAGKRSLAYHVYFQAPDRTLTAEEVSRASQAVLKALEREVGAELRE
jgi:phenylalanyl-tRNA synthetase beta chain